jgi:hypothetical protein
MHFIVLQIQTWTTSFARSTPAFVFFILWTPLCFVLEQTY